nr:MAG TPA: hypothetical protein [Caudoviricetes sp.]
MSSPIHRLLSAENVLNTMGCGALNSLTPQVVGISVPTHR